MRTEKFISDLEKLDPKDFNYLYAYTNRETGKSERLFGKPLDEVLKTCQVCVNGYLLSLINGDNTGYIEKEYGLTEEQLEAISYPECEIHFKDYEIQSPSRNADLETVIEHAKTLFSNEDFINGEFEVVDTMGY